MDTIKARLLGIYRFIAQQLADGYRNTITQQKRPDPKDFVTLKISLPITTAKQVRVSIVQLPLLCVTTRILSSGECGVTPGMGGFSPSSLSYLNT